MIFLFRIKRICLMNEKEALTGCGAPLLCYLTIIIMQSYRCLPYEGVFFNQDHIDFPSLRVR